MPKFSAVSKRRLNTCHPAIQQVFRKVIQTMDCTILEGYRDQPRQDRLWKVGKSKKRFPGSRHNRIPSEAVDVAPYWPNEPHIRWPAPDAPGYAKILGQWYFFAGYVLATADSMEIPMRWGGDWDRDYYIHDNRFDDLCHFELVNAGAYNGTFREMEVGT